jgi:hypothetical protein
LVPSFDCFKPVEGSPFLFKNDLGALGPHKGFRVGRLKACFDPWWPFPKLTPAQIDIFRSVIHPEVVIRASETDLAVLDLRQERNARARGMVIASAMAWPAPARPCC